MKNINFSFQTGVTGELLEGLSAKRYDLVFASYPPAESKLVSVPVSQQDLVLIVPKGHPLAGVHVIDLADTLSKQKTTLVDRKGLFFCHCTMKEMHFGFDRMVLNHHDLKMQRLSSEQPID